MYTLDSSSVLGFSSAQPWEQYWSRNAFKPAFSRTGLKACVCVLSLHPGRAIPNVRFALKYDVIFPNTRHMSHRQRGLNYRLSSYGEGSCGIMESKPKDPAEIWKEADAVCFDVDSTVCMDEGIDALGEYCGAGEAVATWTSRAMGGSVPFEEALSARLALFTPTLADVEKFLVDNPPKLTSGIEELVEKLQSKGTAVYLVSGGFHQMIAPVAKRLKIPDERIFANRLLFDERGKYVGIDSAEPTSRSGGKAAAIGQIKQKYGYNHMVMVGDGATDLEARQPGGADSFICFGGVHFRPSVASQADWCVLDFKDLLNALD